MLERARAEVPPHRGAAGRARRRRRAACATPPARPPCGSRRGTDPPSSASWPPGRCATTSPRRPTYPLLVERELALYGAWYEIFPRCEGATYDEKEHRWTSGTLRTAAERLPAIAAMGFDVVYLTPIHPIGRRPTARARTTPSTPAPSDPGSPVRHRLARRRARRHPPRPRHVRGLRRLRRRGRAELGHGGRHRHRPAVLPRPPVGQDPPRVVHHARRRHHRVRGEPAEEVPGHLPAELRQRPGRHLRRDAPGHPGVDRPRRHRCSASTTRTPSRWSSGSG